MQLAEAVADEHGAELGKVDGRGGGLFREAKCVERVGSAREVPDDAGVGVGDGHLGGAVAVKGDGASAAVVVEGAGNRRGRSLFLTLKRIKIHKSVPLWV